jgi:hypothetical protein
MPNVGGGNQSLLGLRHTWYDVIRVDQREVNCKGGNWTELTSRMSNDDFSERCFHVSEQIGDHLDKHVQRNLSYMEPGPNGHMSLVKTFLRSRGCGLPKVQTLNTCIKRNFPGTKKKGPLLFRYK